MVSCKLDEKQILQKGLFWCHGDLLLCAVVLGVCSDAPLL